MKKDSKPLILTFFKENYASRTFEVPVKWVYQMGSYLIFLTIVTFLTFGLAIRFYFESRKSIAPTQETVVVAPEKKTVVDASPTPVASVASATPSATPTVAAQTNQAARTTVASLFEITRGLSDRTIPQPADIRVELEKPKPRMSDGHLFVDSAIRYVADDGEIQRGYILILVHTAKDLVAYPARSLTGKKDAPQVEAGAGEFFAVGRYREIHAEFTGVHSLGEIKKIELLLISNDKKPLTMDSWTP